MVSLRIEQVKSGAWCVYNVLSKDECQEIIQMGLDAGIEESPARGDRRHRQHNVHHFENATLAQKLWQQISRVVPREYNFSSTTNSNEPVGFEAESVRDMIGRWQPHGVKSTFTLLYYQEGDHFGPHRDGYKIISDHERSILTLALYLNDRPAGHGGATQFVREEAMTQLPKPEEGSQQIRASDDVIEVQVEADQAGKALIFQHDLMHQGESIKVKAKGVQLNTNDEVATSKWLLLTQILYRRDPATAPAWTEDQYEARRVLALAEKAEVEGDIPSAIRLYNKAYRLDPDLELQ